MFASTQAWGASGVAMDVMAAAADTPERLAARQAARLRALVAHAQSASPLMARRLAGIDPARAVLADLPVSHRGELMAHFADWVTDPVLDLAALRAFTADPTLVGQPFAGRYTVWESSGTSGVPGMFVQDPGAMAVYDALEWLRRSEPDPWRHWLNPLGLGERWAFIGATGGHFASLVTLERLLQRHPAIKPMVRAFTIQQPTAGLVAELEDFAPTVVATYPTVAGLLADEAAAGRLAWRPREVWTGGETLSPALRRHIGTHLGAALRNSYGASEFLPMGWECRHGALHLNADWVILEAVDAEGRPVPPGEFSHSALLTNLANKVQPLLRYELGDRIRFAPERCACGAALPVVEVMGRLDDPLRMAGPHGTEVTLLPMALSTVLEDDAGVYDFELEQRDAHTLVLKLPHDLPDVQQALDRGCRMLREFAAQQGVQRPEVIGELVHEACARGRSGKARRVHGPGSAPASAPGSAPPGTGRPAAKRPRATPRAGR